MCVPPVGTFLAGLFGKRLGDHAQRLSPGRNVHVLANEPVFGVLVRLVQFDQLRSDIERRVMLLKLLMPELKRRFRVLDALENVVGCKAREDPWCSCSLDSPAVQELSYDGGNNRSRIPLPQSHCSLVGHLRCESLQKRCLLAVDRSILQGVSVLLSLFMQMLDFGEDAELRSGDLGLGFVQRRHFREDERSACQSVERRVGLDAGSELSSFLPKAGFQVASPLPASHRQQPQSQRAGQRRGQMVGAGRDDDASARKLPLELS